MSQLFTAVVRHGYVPKLLRDCILQLIPKSGKDPTCSDNYRPIALAPTLSKVLEWCILLIYRNSLSTSLLQFGFKPGMSADMCTGLIKNVISRYCFNGSNVFGSFLDASKAFDRVSHLKLFSKLHVLEKNLPPTIIRLLFSWYRDQNFSVLWNKTLSENFSVSNGVRQGGVLSNLRSLEVTFNNLLRKIWKSPWHCHTSILHCISSLQSLYNVICHSHMLCQKARATGISLIREIFTEAPQLSDTTFGFNAFNYSQLLEDLQQC